MSKPAIFTQTDVARLLKGAKAAGMKVRSVEIDRQGKIIAQFEGASDDRPAGNEWDVVFDAEEKRLAKGRH